jgi:hypothetical protein
MTSPRTDLSGEVLSTSSKGVLVIFFNYFKSREVQITFPIVFPWLSLISYRQALAGSDCLQGS